MARFGGQHCLGHGVRVHCRRAGEVRDKWELDTARMYCYGTTETFIGKVFEEDPTLREK